MRSLNLILGFLSVFLVLVTRNAGAAGQSAFPFSPVDGIEEGKAAAYVLSDVERLRILDKADGCDDLGPMPLYAGAPSVEDWETYCRAVVEANSDSCKTLPAMIVPDLRGLCFSELHS